MYVRGCSTRDIEDLLKDERYQRQSQRNAREAEVVEASVATVRDPIVDAMPDPVPDTPAWTVPTTPQGRWNEWERLSVLREEELTCEWQKKWRLTYQATAEFRIYQRKSA